jgi:anti-sigma regulatory factor (Ser/Thr protein kinase)
MKLAMKLPAIPESVPVARHVLDRLDGSLPAPMLQDLRLLVSEIVTNSIRHGPTEQAVELRVRVDRRMVRVEVEDGGPGFEPPTFAARSELEAGWGLMLVDRLADRWGVSSGRNTTVWFEIDRPG